ncbi:MAG: SurA N-terminal domain-containing protein [Proteobacteria bacterium]|nr:SurA N-terminal domain-containing protein [Pseudomonadota bacterium]MBU1387601.1 SurA N-terminal domain-containing protein [Pseudomonadota bacterium]MBU1544192.1 SurA N-terminal domain-containing protein [Pseudomonadota bacterium]
MNTRTRFEYLFNIVLIFLLPALIFGCMDADTDHQDNNTIARINGYHLTLDEYESKLVREMEYDQTYKITDTARKEFLDALIRKEILVQEAVRLKLNKRQVFKAAIEKYWEATLVKTLMEEQAEQINKTTYITENEIREKYEQLKLKNASLPPFKQMEKDIALALKEEKKTLLLDEWINALTEKADIRINQTLLKTPGDLQKNRKNNGK